MAISVWQEKAERARAALATLREKTKSVVAHARRDGETIAGGALAGAIRGAFEASGKEYSVPGPNGMKIPPEVLMAGLVLGVAYSGQTDVSDDLHALGAGIGAYGAGREAEKFMAARGAKPPGAMQ